MSTSSDFYVWLKAQPGIAASVGDRIYPVTIPQGAAYPCIRFEVDENGGAKDFDGQGDTIMSDFQVDSLAVTMDDAADLAEEVITAMKNYTGPMTTRTVQRISLEAEFNTYEDNIADGTFRVSQAWTIWHY